MLNKISDSDFDSEQHGRSGDLRYKVLVNFGSTCIDMNNVDNKL